MKLHFPFLLWDHPKIYPIPIEVGGYVYDIFLFISNKRIRV